MQNEHHFRVADRNCILKVGSDVFPTLQGTGMQKGIPF